MKSANSWPFGAIWKRHSYLIADHIHGHQKDRYAIRCPLHPPSQGRGRKEHFLRPGYDRHQCGQKERWAMFVDGYIGGQGFLILLV